MSGGSWDYIFNTFDDVASRLKNTSSQESCCELRRGLGKLIEKIAMAMHEIEWVDSGDSGAGDEEAAIVVALGQNHRIVVLEELETQTKQLLEKLQKLK